MKKKYFFTVRRRIALLWEIKRDKNNCKTLKWHCKKYAKLIERLCFEIISGSKVGAACWDQASSINYYQQA
jgi:hypothetical protein